MQYDFTTIMDRRGKDALAVDALGHGWAPDAPKEGFDAIPMWVADMNFATVPTITEAIIARVQHPAFGYFEPREEYFRAIIDWQRPGISVMKTVFWAVCFPRLLPCAHAGTTCWCSAPCTRAFTVRFPITAIIS